jgi:hypothetical protein
MMDHPNLAWDEEIQELIDAAVAAAREACAQIAEGVVPKGDIPMSFAYTVQNRVAAAIRARGQKEPPA